MRVAGARWSPPWSFNGIVIGLQWDLPSGKHTKTYGKPPFFVGKSTMNGVNPRFQWAMFNSYVSLPEGNYIIIFN